MHLVLSISVPPDHPLRLTARYVQEDLARRSEKNIRLTLDLTHDGGPLPSEALRDPYRMRMASIGFFAGYFQPLGAFEAPYVFTDAEHMFRVLRSEWGQRLLAEAQKRAGHRILAIWYEGVRHVTLRDRPATTPEEFGDIKLRVPASAQHVETARVLGAQPTTMGLRNVYTGLRIGTIDAQENPLPTTTALGFDEVCEYLVLTHHRVSAVFPVIADSIWQRLAPAERTLIEESFRAGGRRNREIVENAESRLINELDAAGMEVLAPDLAPFRRRARHAWRRYSDIWGDSVLVRVEDMRSAPGEPF